MCPERLNDPHSVWHWMRKWPRSWETDAHATHLQDLANASGFTRNEVMRRVLSNTKIPSARTCKEVRDIPRIQREQNRLGGQ